MSIPTMEGIRAETITTDRITTRVLFHGPKDGLPVIFLHGNVTSATWWEDSLSALPDAYFGIAPDQRGFGESDPNQKIDATRGMADLAEDALALLDQLSIQRAFVVANSLGGMVAWDLIKIAPQRLLGVVLVNPGSPYGFGSTKNIEGEPTTTDFAGSGGGLSNPELIKRMAEGDRSLDSPFSPRMVIRTLLVKPPFVPEREDALLDSLLATHLGDQDIPGDSEPSSNWPFVAPGKYGATNATSPKYQSGVDKIIHADPKPNILWVRGSDDVVVSDTAASDPGTLGRMGLMPNWPGDEVFPPQPMIGQIRAVLDAYEQAGGSTEEIIIDDTGHVPFIEKPDEFNAILLNYLQANP